MDIIVHAKVLRVEEEDLGKSLDELGQVNWVWNALSLRLDDINRIWGQSKNRSVILLYSGELILVAEPHKQLHDRLNVARINRIEDQPEETSTEEDMEETEETSEEEE